MRTHTVVIQFADGDGPGYHKGMQALGGEVVAVQFSDALVELEILTGQRDDLLLSLEECISYAEDCVNSPDFKKGVVAKHVRNAREAIAAATGETK